MARYSASFTSVTTSATANSANLANTSYPTVIQGGSGTMRININEVYMGGENASSSTLQIMKLARDSTVAATLSGTSSAIQAQMDASSTAPGTTAVVGNSWTTLPQRSPTLQLLNLSFNAYGGTSRWQARYGEEISVVGNTNAGGGLGEVSLSAFTGTSAAPISGHILFEVA